MLLEGWTEISTFQRALQVSALLICFIPLPMAAVVHVRKSSKEKK